MAQDPAPSGLARDTMRHQRVEEWEERLNELLKRVDHALEARFGDLLPPHPARPPRGATANPQHDGLFRVTASFTAGFGSPLGRGYRLWIDIVSLDTLPEARRRAVERRAAALIRCGLRDTFPGRSLSLRREGHGWKIVGDLSLAPSHDGMHEAYL